MHNFLLNQNLTPVTNTDSISDPDLMVRVLTHKEASSEELPSVIYKHLRIEQGIRFCKADELSEYYIGSLYIPSHNMTRSHTGFYFILMKRQILFIDDSGMVLEHLNKMTDTHYWSTPGIGFFFSDFLESLLNNDTVFITDLEHHLEKLEDAILERGSDQPFNHTISGYRRKISLFSHYYLQLADMGTLLCSNHNHLFSEAEERGFGFLVDRATRLHEEAQMLRDYCAQIREVYQSMIDERQNEIMKILTIVTTVVLPLTLLVGWYGMNFSGMPELKSRLGYPIIIVVSILITAWNIWYFKKKKFW